MNTILSFRMRLAACTILFASSGDTFAATYHVPLYPSVASGTDGDYLTAPFDLGTRFASIQEVTLAFEMPGGYEGAIFTTGNSTYDRVLAVVLSPDPHVSETYPTAGLSSLETRLGMAQLAYHVPANLVHEIPFVRSPGIPTNLDGFYARSEFLLQGRGHVAFIDIRQHHYHPLLDPTLHDSSSTWQPPTEIVNARLTIVGTVVPEPSSLALLLAMSSSLLAISPRSERAVDN